MDTTKNESQATEIPRSHAYKHKQIICEKYIKMHGQVYYFRRFNDGSAELVSYDEPTKKWVFLCFAPDETMSENTKEKL